MLFPSGPSLPPWAKDPAVTNVYLGDAKSLGYPSPGSLITGWSPAKGAAAPIVSNCVFRSGYDAKGRSYVGLNFTSASYATIDSLAAGVSGTAKPFTLIVSAQIPVTPSTPWYLI